MARYRSASFCSSTGKWCPLLLYTETFQTFTIKSLSLSLFLIYSKARAGELVSDSGLGQLARLTEINVDEVGVGGAKSFFEAKIEQQLRTNKFHDEIRQEQEERRRMEEERVLRRQQFQQRAAVFQ